MHTMNRTELAQFISKAVSKCQVRDGWIHLSALGTIVKQLNPEFAPQAFGYPKLVELLNSFPDIVEVRTDTQYYPPVVFLRPKGVTNLPQASSVPIVSSTRIQRGDSPSPRRGNNLPILDWAYIPDIQKTVQDLKELALGEQWSFGGDVDPEYPYPILWNYLRYTFLRLQRESKICEARDMAAFNTGLVDNRFEPIHAVFRKNQNVGRQRWYGCSFCIAGEGRDGKDLVRTFNPLPQPAHYFVQVEDMIYDVTAGKPEVDWEHVIIENIDRLPFAFLRDHAPVGFEFRDPSRMTFPERQAFFAALGEAVRNDSKTYRAIKNRLVDALDLAIKRTRWNFKTAIPQYYPRQDAMTLLLPLALVAEDRVDLALVVEKTRSGSYLGHTIFPLHWAYMNARLVCRPDSDWLVPSSIASVEYDPSAVDESEIGNENEPNNRLLKDG